MRREENTDEFTDEPEMAEEEKGREIEIQEVGETKPTLEEEIV